MSFSPEQMARFILVNDFGLVEEELQGIQEEQGKFDNSKVETTIEQTRNKIREMLENEKFQQIPAIGAPLNDLDKTLRELADRVDFSFENKDLKAIQDRVAACKKIPALSRNERDEKILHEMINKSLEWGDYETAYRLTRDLNDRDREETCGAIASNQFEAALKGVGGPDFDRAERYVFGLSGEKFKAGVKLLLDKIQKTSKDLPATLQRCLNLITNAYPDSNEQIDPIKELLAWAKQQKEFDGHIYYAIINQLPFENRFEYLHELIQKYSPLSLQTCQWALDDLKNLTHKHLRDGLYSQLLEAAMHYKQSDAGLEIVRAMPDTILDFEKRKWMRTAWENRDYPLYAALAMTLPMSSPDQIAACVKVAALSPALFKQCCEYAAKDLTDRSYPLLQNLFNLAFSSPESDRKETEANVKGGSVSEQRKMILSTLLLQIEGIVQIIDSLYPADVQHLMYLFANVAEKFPFLDAEQAKKLRACFNVMKASLKGYGNVLDEDGKVVDIAVFFERLEKSFLK